LPSAYAAGYSGWATPAEIITHSGGLIIKGTFGNIDGCADSTAMSMTKTTNQYGFAKVTVLTALMGVKESKILLDRLLCARLSIGL